MLAILSREIRNYRIVKFPKNNTSTILFAISFPLQASKQLGSNLSDFGMCLVCIKRYKQLCHYSKMITSQLVSGLYRSRLIIRTPANHKMRQTGHNPVG